MEQMGGENHQQELQQTPLKCPRCSSLDTKFRYFNNHSVTQPRHYCKTCKRHWTVGGNLRDIPVGGNPRRNKQTKASSSRCTKPQTPPPQPTLPLGEEHLQYSQSLTPMAMLPQYFDTNMTQPVTSLPAAVTPLSSFYFDDEISCFDTIQSLIQPDFINQHANAGYQLASDGANMAIPHDWNIQSMASQQALPQQIPTYVESYQTHNQVNNATPNLYNSLVQPTWPMSSMRQDLTDNFNLSTSNAIPWNNFSGNTTITNTEMDTTSINADEWLNFSGYGSS